MKIKASFLFCASLIALVLAQHSLASTHLQNQSDSRPKVSEAEAKALTAIDATPDTAAKLTAAVDFAKKYPKSPALSQLAENMAILIAKVTDPTQKLALADSFEKAFTDPLALAIIQSARIDAYIAAKQLDQAFALTQTILSRDPEELHTLIQMTLTGTEEAKRGNAKYLPQTKQYGLKAIEIIESNKKPAQMDDATWTRSKTLLPTLYQQTAILAMLSQDAAEARARLDKAISLDPTDPSNYAFSGFLTNNNYMQLASTYKTMPEGKEKQEMLPKLEGMIDSIIDAYAHAVGLATGRAEYQTLLNQLLPDLTSYYKFRHQQSVEGLQQLIDKHKVQPATKP